MEGCKEENAIPLSSGGSTLRNYKCLHKDKDPYNKWQSAGTSGNQDICYTVSGKCSFVCELANIHRRRYADAQLFLLTIRSHLVMFALHFRVTNMQLAEKVHRSIRWMFLSIIVMLHLLKLFSLFTIYRSPFIEHTKAENTSLALQAKGQKSSYNCKQPVRPSSIRPQMFVLLVHK